MDTTRTLKNKVIKEKKFFYLTVLHTPDVENLNKSVQISERETFVGREADFAGCIKISDSMTSRRHASIRLSHGKLHIADLSSKNGTYVNGQKIAECALGHNDIIRIGNSILYISSLDINIPPPLPVDIDIIGRSPALRLAVEKSMNAARTAHPVLITGESGTGKELFAHFMHKISNRRGQFVPINCASIPENLVESTLFGHRKGAFTGAATDSSGYFQSANRGTLFLDEVAELPFEQQAKLLRALENCEIIPVGMSAPVK
ncbi:MAG: sigma-54-dependent Fis family transcriptional regulator, partial [Deltaproteobacteria bacterium]|nr:sigma-54-dependent Fis family transcriptional regulator [Deltaproteobacteria bacterium]